MTVAPAFPAVPRTDRLADAVWQAVAYADVFDFPLTRAEVWSFLPVAATRAEVDACLEDLVYAGTLDGDRPYVFLSGRPELPALRRQREEHAARLWRRARGYARAIWMLPFVRMVAVTGSLAMDNVEPDGDIDFMLVTEPGRLWMTRAMVLLICRAARLVGDTLCPNYLLSTQSLRLDVDGLYAAHELVQMVPLHGSDIASQLWEENSWSRRELPNAPCPCDRPIQDHLPVAARILRSMGQLVLGSRPLDRLERWERRRKIARLSAVVPPENVEVRYSADVCKGHDRAHGFRAMTLLAERRGSLSAPASEARHT